MPLILVLLVIVGLVAGGQINRAIYGWAFNARPISPWATLDATSANVVAKRTWLDRVPVLGWWWLRRESGLHGAGFWIRPMLIELGFGVGLASLYWWEVGVNGWDRSLFFSHAVLFGFMTIATFIDFDERMIPDSITVTGTIIALLFAAFLPRALLPVTPLQSTSILTTTPFGWPTWLDGTRGLIVGLACWAGWCCGLLPRTVYFRRGLMKGIRYLFASMFRCRHEARARYVKRTFLMCGLGATGIVLAWLAARGGLNWRTLLSSLIAMAMVGGFVWSIRIVTSVAVGIEALGFGDVTLMAMVGAFLGWQAGVLAFFLAPFTGLLLIIPYWLLTKNRHIAFGPFLCAGTSIVMVGWDLVWMIVRPYWTVFGPIIPLILATLVVLMGALLALIELIKRMLGLRTLAELSR